MRYLHLRGILFASCLLLSFTSYAEESNLAPFATVNGETLSVELFQFLLGARDSEQNPVGHDPNMSPEQQRMKVAEDLVITEVLAQEALRRNIDDQPRVRIELELARKTLLAQMMVQELMAGFKVSDTSIRKAYDDQQDTTLYRFNLWMTSSEEDAKTLLTDLKNASGEQPSNSQYEKIETPWLDQSELEPQVVDRLENVEAGAFLDEPVFQDGLWKVVQVIERDIFEKPVFEEAREIIKSQLIQEQVDEAIKRLSQSAEIEVNDAYL